MIRTTHVGTSGRGRWPLELLGEDPRFEPVALVDLSADALAQGRARTGLPESACFDDLERALDAVETDAVIICTPTVTHVPLARIACDRGKHVLVEKAMAVGWDEAVALVRHAEAADVCLCVAQNVRHRSVSRTIKALLDDPTHPHHPGEVRIVDMLQHRHRNRTTNMNYEHAMIWDMCCHHMDTLFYWLGPIERITARTYDVPWSPFDHPNNILAIVEFASGAMCNYHFANIGTLAEHRGVLQGERGALRTLDMQTAHFFARPEGNLGKTEPIECEPFHDDRIRATPQGVHGIVDAWHRYITEGEEPGISGRHNLETIAACEMLARSGKAQRPVTRDELAEDAEPVSGRPSHP